MVLAGGPSHAKFDAFNSPHDGRSSGLQGLLKEGRKIDSGRMDWHPNDSDRGCHNLMHHGTPTQIHRRTRGDSEAMGRSRTENENTILKAWETYLQGLPS